MINETKNRQIKLQLSRNLVKKIKQGHSWVYADALRGLPAASPGTHALLLDNRGGKPIARGYYEPENPIAFRVCTTNPDQLLDRAWARNQIETAAQIRRTIGFPNPATTAYRLFNGEGDGLPGLICDVYENYAVIATDGPGAAIFWDPSAIAHWLNQNLGIEGVLLKSRTPAGKTIEAVYGSLPEAPVTFSENSVQFTADLIEGQKTGFFLDQRENRSRILPLANGKSVLNLFGYTGGFSVYAGLGGASKVVTVDQASLALSAADLHWQMNQLETDRHTSICGDAFDYLNTSIQNGNFWDLVILDPPSFAPSEAAVPQATQAYTRLIELAARVTKPGGTLAPSSCSSHIDPNLFLEIIEDSISRARRKATVLGIYGQPADHPSPLVMPELRYLKFVLLRLD